MKRSFVRIGLVLLLLVALPYRAPAPLIYRPGEGWSYELPGAKGDWRKLRAKEQLDVAQQAFDQKKYKLALKASQRVISVWPLSDYAPKAQYLEARCYEMRKQDEKAFNSYQTLLDKYPKAADVKDVQQRQFVLAVRFLHGQWFKLWGYIPFFPSMDKTADMFEKIVRYGPYGDLGPPSQMNIGAAREKEKDFPLAVKAYELAADRYNEQPQVAADALYKAALAYNKQARKADYDQSVAGQAISAFTDFMALYPNDPRVTEAQRIITQLKTVEADGNFRVAQYYEKQKQWAGAMVYYNEVLIKNPSSPLAAPARQRIDVLVKRAAQPAQPARLFSRRQPSHRLQNRRSMRPLFLFFVAALLAGCAGYRLGPTNGIPAGSRSVEVRLFINKTHEPRVTEYVAAALRKQLQQDGSYRLETSGRGDILVTGQIIRFDRSGLSYQTNDVLTPQEYALALVAHVQAVNINTGKTNFSKDVFGRTYMRVGNDESSAEREAMPLLAEDLARNAVSLLVDGDW